jgi:hypothetical protein
MSDHDPSAEEEDNPLLEATVFLCYLLMGLTVVVVLVYEVAKIIGG